MTRGDWPARSPPPFERQTAAVSDIIKPALPRFHRSRLALSAFVRPSAERKELVLYAGLYAATAGALKLTGFVLFLWIARTLSVEAYADFGLSYALQTGLAMVALAGIVEAAVGLLNQNRTGEQRDALFAAANTAFLLMAGPITAVAMLAYVGLIRSRESGWATLAYVLVSGILLGFAALQSQLVRLQEKHVASMAFSFLAPLIGFAGGYLAFVVDQTVQSFFLGTTLGMAATLVGLRLWGIGFYQFRDGVADARPIFRGVGPFIAIAALGWLGGYGNTYVIEVLFAPTDVARFTFALMVTSIMQLIATALNQVWSPRFFRLIQEASSESVERGNRMFFRGQGLALGLTGGILLAVFPAAMRALGGNLVAYESMRLELLFLVMAYVILSPWWHCYNYYVVHGEGQEAMRLTLATSVLGMAVWMALMWMLGPLGIYAGFLMQMLLRMLAIVILAKRRWHITIAWDGVAAGLFLVLLGFAASK